MLRRLRDDGVNVDGESIESRPNYFLGALVSPIAALPHYEAIITEKKINAGAQFIQTPPIFDIDGFNEWLEALDKRNLLGKVHLIPAIALLKNTWQARFLANEVPGVRIPIEMMAQLENTINPQEESFQIALNLIAKLRKTPGIHGLHILAPNLEELVPRLVKESGLRNTAQSVSSHH
jgi:methylenetetrahydrofolate reductase (NADPH)